MKKKGDGLIQKNFFNWLHFFFTQLFLYHKEVTRVFSSMSNIAWQFSYQWNQHYVQFCHKLKYPCMQIWSNKIWYLHCPDLFVYTSSRLAFFLMQWVKSTVILLLRPCFKFSCGQELFHQFSPISSWLERNNKSPVKSVQKRQTVSRETLRQGTDKIIIFAMFINPYV